jgi:hypothetical protein
VRDRDGDRGISRICWTGTDVGLLPGLAWCIGNLTVRDSGDRNITNLLVQMWVCCHGWRGETGIISGSRGRKRHAPTLICKNRP